jgi:ribonuclease P protein component
VHGPLFTLVGWQAERSSEPTFETRLGVITSKKVGAATVRNKVRRRLRELHRLHRPELARGWWLVVIARAAAAEASWEELRTEWLRLGRKLSIFRAS